MFWMKWICREVRGAAAAPSPTTSPLLCDTEDDAAAGATETGEPVNSLLVLLQTLQRLLPYLLWVWAELCGRASRSSAEQEYR